MCGLLGISTKSLTKEKIKKILSLHELIHHRGPDDLGTYKNKNIFLVHKRLSIVDLKNGAQPLKNEKYVLIANGEIYNDLELRKQLTDFNYKTNSDCESIIAVYSEYGIDGFKKLRGMYAFVLYDLLKKELIMCRDPFGIKPLYFAVDKNNRNLVFCSEIKPIIESGFFEKKILKSKIFELLQIQFNCGRETIYEKVLRLRPGEIVVIRNNKINKSKIIPFDNLKKVVEIDQKNIKNKLLRSVELHQRSDVPYGIFFSGGIDSTTVLYLMSLLNKKPINVFTIVFPEMEQNRNELKDLSKKLNSNIKFVDFDENDFWNLLPKSIQFMDDPVLDYAVIPTYRLAQEAKKHVKVVLTGEGGDELFAGYGRYKNDYLRFLRSKFLEKGLLDKLLGKNYGHKYWDFKLSFTRTRIENSDMTNLQKKQIFDYHEWLPNNLLVKLDRCLMAHSLEGRTPLVDKELFETFFFMKDNNKIKNNYGKFCLRYFLAKEIDTYNSFAKKKGFTVPISTWIPRKSKILAQLLPKNKILKDLIRPSTIKYLCENSINNKRAATMVWRLVFFSIWFLVHHQNVKIVGNSFDILENYN